TVEGIGNVTMVRCGAHGTPRYNSDSISDVPGGEQIQMGNAISTDEDGEYPATGDFAVISKGNGNFRVSINTGNSTNNAEIIPNYTDQPSTVTVTDNGELYTVTGAAGSLGSTALFITARCL
ncbi:MAG TPA: hypothetical protein VH234_06105, partial [Candidatus Saccharimonadales bacterium]|nr:hypothetical protein [Candidatus Saccharimonadales bacterium]